MEFELNKSAEVSETNAPEVKAPEVTTPDKVTEELQQKIENIAVDSPEVKAPDLKNKDSRGRHKKECNCEKCIQKRGGKAPEVKTPEANTQTKKGEISDTDFNDIINQYERTAPPLGDAPPVTEPKAVVLISGYVFLLCLDAVVPSLCLKVFKMIDRKGAEKIDVKKVKLTTDQKRALEPIADQAAKIIFTEMHPVPALLLGMGFMYIGNIINELDN